jgi:hypothetical protein
MQSITQGTPTSGDAPAAEKVFDPSLLSPKRKAPTPIHFDAFPTGRWEVVWLGDVSFRLRHRMHSQPTVSAVLRSLDMDDCRITEIQVPIAQLFALHLGSIWQDKVRQDECSQAIERRDISFGSERAIPCSVGVTLEDELNGIFMLPFSEFHYHSNHTKGWCLRVAMPRAIYIFPALELIRFYFGSSGSLLKHVFNPGFGLPRIASQVQLNSGLAKVTLAHDIPATSAADVARIAFDPRASAFAKLIGSSLQAASATDANAKLYPRATLPFSGRTEMKVIGIPVQPESITPRFVVQRIISCSAAFPFKELQYVASGQVKKRVEHVPAIQQTACGDPVSNLIRIRSAPGVLTNTEPKKSKATQRLAFEDENRFPDLSRKPVSRVDGEMPRQVQISHLPPVAFGSTGDGNSTSHGLRCEPTLITDQRKLLWKFKTPSAEWASFFSLIGWLSDQTSVEHLCFVPIDSRQAQPHYCTLPELIDEDGVLINDTLNVDGRHRLASAVNMFIAGRPVALLSLAPTTMCNSIAVMVLVNYSFVSGGALPAVAAALTCKDDDVLQISLPKYSVIEDISDAGSSLLKYTGLSAR